MLYHYFFLGKNDLLFGKLGIYGVSVFFILSGLSMSIVYNGYTHDSRSVVSFYAKRFFRIAPLYILACVAVLVLNGIDSYDIKQILLNVFVVFGYVDSTLAIPMGGWSIGNEMFFYFLTPLILYIYDKRKSWGNVFLFVTIIIGLYFSFIGLDSSESLQNQWKTYVNPFNNLFLYVIGIAMYYNFAKFDINNKKISILLFVSFLLFVLYPYSTTIDIVTNVGRIIFVIISAIWVFCFFKMKIKSVSKTGKLFEMFGIATYGVYILHPIIQKYVFGFMNILNINYVPITIILLFSCILTIMIALCSYYFFELKISKWGNRLIKKIYGPV